MKKTKKEQKKEVKKLMGVKNRDLLQEILVKASMAMPTSMPSEKKMQAIGNSILEMQAKDPIEAKLYAKEAALYSLFMHYLNRAEMAMFSEGSDIGGVMMYETIMNFALKLSREHNETIETLHRYRKGGEQKVVVQHQYVQVNEGGKAVVSNQILANPEGGPLKIQGGTPCLEKFVEQEQEQLAINHVDNQQWPMDVAACMEEKVLAPRLKKAKDAQNLQA
jgi:hypothetical protein